MPNDTKNETAPVALPLAPIIQTVRVEVRNAREFRPEGKHDVFYSADAEVATPGQRWQTLRLTVRSSTGPVPTGPQNIVIDGFDLKKGEGAAHVV